MRRCLATSLLFLSLAAPQAFAADDGGGSGGGSSLCNLVCDILHGSCTIPSGDPTIPPLKDPFCAERKANCKARCNGAGGGGGGGFIIGQQMPVPRPLMTPAHAPRCGRAETHPG